jgi:hypothetical protein
MRITHFWRGHRPSGLALTLIGGLLLLAHGAQAGEIECGRLLRWDDTHLTVRSKTGEVITFARDLATSQYTWAKVRGSQPPALCWARNEGDVPLPQPRPSR